ncbi:MAG TPA: hypothetical protein VFJ91_00830 [Gaiellaceae bacterium]|nr:hypothetical protein [Gaiellaceae bacterium]
MDGTFGGELLALSSGFTVMAGDGEVGVVETPLFPPDETTPDFLVLRVGRIHPRRPVLAAALVERVDPHGRVVHVRASRDDVLGLPEHLPLAI